MGESVYKIIELVGTSETSWEENVFPSPVSPCQAQSHFWS